MKIRLIAVAALMPLAACGQSSHRQEDAQPSQSATPAMSPAMRFEDVPDQPNSPAIPAHLIWEVNLDRLGFSSGVLDGKATRFDAMALRGFQAARGLPQTGRLDAASQAAIEAGAIPAFRTVRIPEGFAKGPFVPDLPNETAKQAGRPFLGYRNLMEALAERFHTTPETIVALNGPQARIGAGAVVRVPNVPEADANAPGSDERGWNMTLAALGVAANQPAAEKLVVSKSEGLLRAYDSGGRLIAQFPVTTGSAHDPLPIGSWKVLGVSRNPDFHYNPKLFWDVADSKPEQLIKPGPNGPVGVVWIDLSKEHYGIHGTNEPASIGHTESHGCVRLTNWDAARLAQMVKSGVAVEFER